MSQRGGRGGHDRGGRGQGGGGGRGGRGDGGGGRGGRGDGGRGRGGRGDGGGRGGGGGRGDGGRGYGGRGGGHHQQPGGRQQQQAPPQHHQQTPPPGAGSPQYQQAPSQGAWGQQQQQAPPQHHQQTPPPGAGSSQYQQAPPQGAWGQQQQQRAFPQQQRAFPQQQQAPPQPQPSPIEQQQVATPVQQETQQGGKSKKNQKQKKEATPPTEQGGGDGNISTPPQGPSQQPAVIQQQQQRATSVEGEKQAGGQSKKKQQKKEPTPPAEQGAGTSAKVEQLASAIKPVTISSAPGDQIKSKLVIAKGGTRGRVVQVYANHLPLQLGKLKSVIQYDVAIDPDRPKKQMRFVMEALRLKSYPNMHPAFDGSKQLYSVKDLFKGNEFEDTISILYDDRKKEYKVKLKKVQVIDMNLINKFYDQVRGNTISDAPQVVLQVIDVVLRHSLATNQICVGNSLFTIPKTDRTVNLGNGMHMYRGIYQSAILGWKPFLNVDVSNKAFPSASNLIDLIKEFDSRTNLNNPLDRFMIDKLKKHLKLLKVQYEIPRNSSSKRIYRVNDVISTSSNDYQFTKDNGQKTNVTQYYQLEKGYRIQYPHMPLLWVGSLKSKIHVPIELCTILPGQPVNRKCDPFQTRVMIKECAKSADDRKNDILHNLREAKYNEDPVVKEFGFSVANEMEKIEARILPPPTIRYRDGQASVAKGVWNARHFYTSGQIVNGWTVLNLERYVKPFELDAFVNLAKKTAPYLGMDLSNFVDLFGKNAQQLRRDLQDLKTLFSKVKERKLDLVFVILSNADKIYERVKNSAEIGIGCLTQCIKSQTLQKRMNDMTMRNILMKVNAKLNGSNHIFHTPPVLMKKKFTMLMGADVTHPSPDVKDGYSVAAVTASHDPNAFGYNICWRLQPAGKEIIADLENITKEQLLTFYRKNNNMKPEAIIVYRDGVSTGQFEEVLISELQAIRRACKVLEADYKPAITFVVVQKRHHTRLFPVDPRISEDRNRNVPAGTIVDKNITHPTRQDFYLVSHASIQGVAKPTKYVTLWDDLSMPDDVIEELTYYLCHMFTRCTRSVSYPAPTYYAHLAAARGKSYCDAVGIDTSRLQREQSNLQIRECIVNDMPMFFV